MLATNLYASISTYESFMQIKYATGLVFVTC